MAETLVYDVLARIRGADELGKLAAVSDLAAAGSAKLKESLGELGKRGDVTTAQLAALSGATRRFGDDEDKLIVKTLAADAAIRRLDDAMKDGATHGDSLAKSAEGAAVGLGQMGTPMAGLIGAGVALAPVIATLGTGMAGFGLAAAGVLAPILKASQSAKGLAGEWSKLNAEQQQAALSVLAVKQDFAGFQKALEPTVLHDFGLAAQFAGNILHDIEPVSVAFGKALGGVLQQIDAEFQGGTWQDFFQFMATTAAPDMKLLGTTITSLLELLPPLLEDIQPLSTGFLQATNGLLQFTAASANFVHMAMSLHGSTSAWKSAFSTMLHGLGDVVGVLPGMGDVQRALFKASDALHVAAPAAKAFGLAAVTAGPQVSQLTQQTNDLTASLSGLQSGLLATQHDQDAWRTSLATANDTLKKNSYDLSLNTQAGRDDREAVINATGAALSFADQQVKTGGDTKGASKVIQDQIDWLVGLHSNTKLVKDEIAALRAEEAKLKNISETITVTGTGRWSVENVGPGGPGHRVGAAGLLVTGGIPGRDSVPILAMPGEAVVPTRLVPAIAPFLKAHGVPGFASGGMVGGWPPEKPPAVGLWPSAWGTLAAAQGLESWEAHALAAHPWPKHLRGGTRRWLERIQVAVAHRQAGIAALFGDLSRETGNAWNPRGAGAAFGRLGAALGGLEGALETSPFYGGLWAHDPGQARGLLSAVHTERLIDQIAAARWAQWARSVRASHPVYIQPPGPRDLFGYTSSGGVTIEDLLGAQAGTTQSAGIFPRFASGGIVGDYSGGMGGMAGWVAANAAATRQLLTDAIGQAFSAGFTTGVPGGVAGPGGGAPAANAALARSLYSALLGPGDWDAWNYVAMRESGWNQFARNPSSGAYGIPQALPESKLPFAGQAAGGSNPMAQIGWMWNYMAGRYGGPRGAAAHELAFNWYDQGGYLPPGLSLAMNGTGVPERVGGGGNTINIVVNMPFGSTRAEVLAGLNRAIDELDRQGRLR